MALELVCILIEHKPPPETDAESLLRTNPAFAGTVGYIRELCKEEVQAKRLAVNEFQRLLSLVEGQPNYKAIYDGLARLFDNFVVINNSALPHSTKQLKCFNELLIFFLRFVLINPVLMRAGMV